VPYAGLTPVEDGVVGAFNLLAVGEPKVVEILFHFCVVSLFTVQDTPPSNLLYFSRVDYSIRSPSNRSTDA